MYDTVIIGGGIAGATAAIYSVRRNLKTLLLTMNSGGQLEKITEIENWPGEINISGLNLAQKVYKQLDNLGVEISFKQAVTIDKKDGKYVVRTSSEEFPTKTVILAFGKIPKVLGIKGEDRLNGRGISYCVTCDGPFFKNKDVAIIGGGNSALDAAILMSKFTSKVYLVHRRDSFSAENHLIDKVKSIPEIEVIFNDSVKEAVGEEKLEYVILTSGRRLSVSGLFIEIGYIVNDSLIKNLIKTNPNGEIIVDNHQSTSKEGIFAAGDMTDTPHKQLIIAAGEGACAALSAYEFIQKKH